MKIAWNAIEVAVNILHDDDSYTHVQHFTVGRICIMTLRFPVV